MAVALSGVHAERFEEVNKNETNKKERELFYKRNLHERNAFIDRYFHQVKTADLPSAQIAPYIIQYSGIGRFNVTQLQKALAGKTVSVEPEISENIERMRGSSSVKDLETLLQLTYLHFTAPRRDEDAYQSLMSLLKNQLINRDKNPKTAFSDSIQMMTSNHSDRTPLYNMALLEKVNLDKALEIYKARFANPADFTFIFVGNIDPKDAKTQELICTWLGGMKTKKNCHESIIDHHVTAATGCCMIPRERGRRQMRGTKTSVIDIIGGTVRAGKGLSALLLLTIAGSVLLALLPPLVLERIVDALAGGERVAFSLAAGYFLLVAASGLLDAAKESLITVFGQRVTHRIRSAMSEKLLRLPAAYYIENEPGVTASRFVNDVNTVDSLFASGVISMAADVCRLLSILLVIFLKSKGLGLLLLITSPLLFWMTRVFQKRMLKAQMEGRVAVGRTNQQIPETLKNIRTIR